MHIFKSSLDNKYFYINSQKKLVNILIKKKITRIPNSQNQKK